MTCFKCLNVGNDVLFLPLLDLLWLPKVELHPVGRNDSLASWFFAFESAAWHLEIWGNRWGNVEELILHQRSALGHSASDLVMTHGILAMGVMTLIDVIQIQMG